jgi:hypothetical protein
MNNAQAFRFRVDASEVAQKLNTTRELIEDKVVSGVETLSIAAHAYIVNLANTKWANDDFKRKYYLGIGEYGKEASGVSTNDPRIDQVPKFVRWVKIADGLWVVELDEKAQWLEQGRPETFMGDWLLKPGAKGVKRAKDGSLYRAIPFKQTEGNAKAAGASPQLAEIVKNYAKQNKISLTKPSLNKANQPILGAAKYPGTSNQETRPVIVQKLDIRAHDATGYAPGVLYSKPRTEADAALSGLKPHEGIFKLAGAVVTQKKTKSGKVKKETVVFRVISSKHKAESRWMYPEVQPANLLQKTFDFANQQWESIVKQIEQSISAG